MKNFIQHQGASQGKRLKQNISALSNICKLTLKNKQAIFKTLFIQKYFFEGVQERNEGYSKRGNNWELLRHDLVKQTDKKRKRNYLQTNMIDAQSLKSDRIVKF